MENENNKEEMNPKETETLDKIIEKLLSVKKYLNIFFILIYILYNIVYQ